MHDNPLMTVKDVAQELKVSDRWVTKQIQEKKLQAIRIGREYRVYRSDLDMFLHKRRTNPEETNN